MKSVLACTAVLGTLLLLSVGPAGAGDGAPAAGVWIFDVHVVRVDSPHPEVAEQASPFAELEGATLGLPWPELLARLKLRGGTTLVLDQRVTAMPGHTARLNTDRTTPVLAVATESGDTAQRRAQLVRTGVKFEATAADDQLLYALEIRGVARTPTERDAVAETTITWNGTHPPLDGRTLVFHHREQVREGEPEATRTVEHYAFVTGRLLGQR